MPRFIRGIHGLHIEALRQVSVDGPDKPGHDEKCRVESKKLKRTRKHMNGIDGGFGIAALGGLISFLSPCVLPLVPAYLCFMAGTTLEDLTDTQSRGPEAARALNRRVLASAIGFVLGFTTVFV